MSRTGAALALLLAASCGSQSGPARTDVHDAWARAPLPGRSETVAYFTLTNSGGSADALLGVSTEVGDASIHSITMDNGVIRMRSVKRVQIAPHSSVQFGPGGYHVMVRGLRRPLQPGSSFPMTFEFEKSGRRQASVTIIAAGDMGPSR